MSINVTSPTFSYWLAQVSLSTVWYSLVSLHILFIYFMLYVMSVPLHTRSLDLKLTLLSVSYILVASLELIPNALEVICFVLNL